MTFFRGRRGAAMTVPPKRYRRRETEISALMFDGTEVGVASLLDWAGGIVTYDGGLPVVHTDKGPKSIAVGDHLVHGVVGEWYPIGPDAWTATHDPILEDEAPATTAADLRLSDAQIVSLRNRAGATTEPGELREIIQLLAASHLAGA